MALSLGTELGTAQDSMSRRPLVEITSGQVAADIPFDGQYLTTETANETEPNFITHSSGRLTGAYVMPSVTSGDRIRFVYSDGSRSFFTFVDYELGLAATVYDLSICELTNGNLGIIFICASGTGRALRYMIVSPTGAVVTAHTLIATYTSANRIDDPHVIRLVNGTFLLVYNHDVVSSNTYSIMKRTSSNFTSWSAEAAITLTGLTATLGKYNSNLVQISTGDIMLWFDYCEATEGTAELTNLYFCVSSNNGSTWSTPTKVTDYNLYSTVASHPVAVQKTADQLHVVYDEVSGVLRIDDATDGLCGDRVMPTDMTFDEVNRKLYVVNSMVTGYKLLYSILKIDIDTWTIDQCWDSACYDGLFHGQRHIWWLRWHGEGSKIIYGTSATLNQNHIDLLDGEADSITHYHFNNDATYGGEKNIPGFSLPPGWFSSSIFGGWYDAATQRIYVGMGYYTHVMVGYLDATEVGPNYTWHQIFLESDFFPYYQSTFLNNSSGRVLNIENSLGYIIIVSGAPYGGSVATVGALKVLTMDGDEVKYYRNSTHPGFPRCGLRQTVVIGNKIYGSFTYEALYGEEDKRGLCCVDLSNDTCVYYRPTWATLDDYGLFDMKASADGTKIYINAVGHGITIFNIVTQTWTLFSNDNVPGMMPDSVAYNDFAGPIIIDEDEGLIYSGSNAGSYNHNAILMLSEYGAMHQAHLMVGTYGGGEWSFGAAVSLVQGFTDGETSVALDPEDQSIYAFWQRMDGSEYSILWDKENSSFDVSDFLVRGEDIVLTRSISGSPATLSFKTSHGHLFDPSNLSSLWSIYFAKFRRINVRFGELIGGDPHWQQAGVFFVKENRLSYERGQYPIIEVLAEDILGRWDIEEVVATDYYETTPHLILENVLEDHAGLVSGQMNIPEFIGSVDLYYQWMDATIKAILDEVCQRFSYYPRIDVGGIVTARRISNDSTIDHVYSGAAWLKNYTPDDSYSDYTNKVTVIGEGRDWVEVLYNEESLRTIDGTCGWWGGGQSITVWYSDDRTRRARNPRLEVILSVSSFNFGLGGGGESIISEAADDKSCVVYIDIPNLILALVFAIAAIIALYIACGGCSWYCGICFAALATLWSAVLNILASVANYRYIIWGRPVGAVRQSFQASANDTELQAQISAVVEKRLEDPFCYGLDQCQAVANQELLIAQLQRKRVKLTKLAHLQDEDGDTIQFLHPYSGQTISLFVTDIARKMRIPNLGQNDGYFLDEIEGWRL